MKNSNTSKLAPVLDANEIQKTIQRFAQRIAKDYGGPESVALVGIRTRGLTIAHRVAEVMEERHQTSPSVGALDITLYRDDLNTLLPQGRIDATDIQFDISNKTLILFDDVLHTGRTVRAAVDHLIALGRPRAIFLAVLIDRGGRELPIEANLVGKKIKVPLGGDVRVKLKEVDKIDEVVWGS